MEKQFLQKLIKDADELYAAEGLCSVTLGAMEAIDNNCTDTNVVDLNLTLSVVKEKVAMVRHNIFVYIEQIQIS